MAEARPTGQPGPPVSATSHGLRRAGVEDIEQLALVFAAAFEEDPIFSWMMPDERSRRRRLRRFFAIELRHSALPRGSVWTTEDLGGVAMSNRPDAWELSWRASLLEGMVFGLRLPRAAKLGSAMTAAHPKFAHHYFRDIGVLPEQQGRGLGRALMAPTLERCDVESLPAYLEATSERSAALYAELGFRQSGEIRVGGSPLLIPMLRRP